MKRMNFISVLAFLCLTFWLKPGEVLSQPLTDSTVNFYTLSAYYDHYYDSLIQVRGAENMKGTGYIDYLRWKWFYTGRHGVDGDLGAMWESIKNYNEYYQVPENYIDESDWQFMGPLGIPLGHGRTERLGTGKGMMLSIWVSEGDHSLIYAGSHHGGLWKTTDGGDNWIPLNDGNLQIHGVNSIAVNPINPDILYISCGAEVGNFLQYYSEGLFKSTDGGISWVKMDIPVDYPVCDEKLAERKIVLHPNYPDNIFFINYRDVYRSTDQGNSWGQQAVFHREWSKWGPESQWGLFDFKISPWDENVAYLAGSEIYRIDNPLGSFTDTNISDEIFFAGLNPGDYTRCVPDRTEISIQEKLPNKIWFCYYAKYIRVDNTNFYRFRIVSYDNTSNNFEVEFDGNNDEKFMGADANKLEFAVSPSNEHIFYVGGVGIGMIDTDNNTQGAIAGEKYPSNCWVHVDIRDMQIFSDELGNDTIYLADDSGISWGTHAQTSSDCPPISPFTWKWTHPCTSIENGLNVTEFYDIGISKSDRDLVAGGCQDLNSMIYLNQEWENFGAGDGSYVIWDPVYPNILYFSDFQFGILYRTNDYGATYPEPGGFYTIGSVQANLITPMELDPLNSSILYSGGKKLLKFSGVNDFGQSVGTPSDLKSFDKSITDIEVVKDGLNQRRFYISTQKKYESEPPYSDHFEDCIFYSSNGTDFTDISANLDCCRYGFICDIEVNPNNINQIWVCATNYSHPWQDSKVYTLDLSSPENVWEDISEGLPPGMPVFKIKYMPQYEMLFAATDVGIFKKAPQDATWLPFKNNLPEKIVTDIEISPKFNTLYAATFGRGLWKSPINCQFNIEPQEVSTQDWTTDMVLNNSIIIPPSVTLTIRNCWIHLPSEAKIVVQQGGTLILDGCTLTSACNDLWWGVEVWGDSRNPQTGNYQGKVIMQNNATIEKARKAIFCGKGIEGGMSERAFNGGIVLADNAIFKNNLNGAMLWTYPFDNISHFLKCKFQTTETLADGSSPEYFMILVQVKGITIDACSFQNYFTDSPSTMHYQGNGIFSLDAKYSVVNDHGDSDYNSYFNNLEFGIYAMKVYEDQIIDIHDSKFSYNLTGVYARAIQNLQLYQNEFELKSLPTSINQIYGGAYLDNCTGYEIHHNKFEGHLTIGVPSVNEIGLTVNNSGEAFNQINNNTFRNLYIGTLAQNNNYSSYPLSGLKILSNCYFDDEYDIAVTGYEGCKDCGIAYYQGAPDAPADNFFSKHDTPDYSDYYNETLPIQYFSPLYNLLDPEEWYPENVSPVPFIQRVRTNIPYTGDCDSRGGLITDIDSIKSLYLTQTYKLDSLEGLLNELIDGGNTQGLVMDIDLSQQEESLELQQELLNTSPYLSDTILIKSAQKEDVLTPALVKDIMVANPQSAKSDKVLEALENRDNPMPELMMQEILLGRDTIGQKEILEAEYSDAIFQKEMALNRLISLYRADTLNDNTDSIAQLLTDYHTLPSKYRLMMLYLEKNDTTSAKNVLADIPQQFELTGPQAMVNDHWNDYLDILLELKKDSILLPDLDSLQIEKLFELGEFADKPGCLAENILHFLGRIEVSPVYILPESQLKSSPDGASINMTGIPNKEPYFRLYPNPADNYLVVEYVISDKSNKGELSVYDSSGKLKYRTELQAIKNDLIIDTKDWFSGIYLFNFITDDHYKQSEKVIIAN